MADFVDAAAGVLAAAQQRVEIAAQNIANMTTPGYRRRVAFEQILGEPASVTSTDAQVSAAIDFTPGKPSRTSNPADLAVAGPGFFTVANPESGRLSYTRNGQFRRDGEGRLVTQAGYILQGDGGPLVVKTDRFQVLDDGTVTEDGEPSGKVSLVDFTDRKAVEAAADGLFQTAAGNVIEVAFPVLRQGALETSNVSTGEEMTSVMASLRRAEAGQRLVNVYDDLMGRVISNFGQN